MSNNILNYLWVEKYRPDKLEDLILPNEYISQFKEFFKSNEIMNLLFYGPPGSGKSSMARILTGNNGILKNIEDNLLELNGSSKTTRGINFVSEVIEPFLRIPPFGDDKIKIVFIDEGDQLTDASFHSLRSTIEKYSDYNRFIVTCNYISKIPDAIQSRFSKYKFQQVPKEYIGSFCKNILNLENIKYSDNDLSYIINSLYPDIRQIINKLQTISYDGELKLNKKNIETDEQQIVSNVVGIISIFTTKNNIAKPSEYVSSITNLLNNYELDYKFIYTSLFNNENVPVNIKIIINKYGNSHSSCLVDSIHFMAMLFEIIECLKEYNKLTSKV